MSIYRSSWSLDSESILRHKVFKNAISLYPLVRWDLYGIVQRRVKDKTAQRKRGFSQILRMISALFFFLVRNPFCLQRQRKYLFITTAVSADVQIGHRFLNRIEDYYSDYVGDEGITFERANRLTVQEPRFNQRIVYYDSIKLISTILSFFTKMNQEDKACIRAFTEEVFEAGQGSFSGSDSESFIKSLERQVISKGIEARIVSKLVKKLGIDTVFLNCASYGVDAILIDLLKKNEVMVAEFQHGTITPAHAAYNYSPSPGFEEVYRDYLPDILLVYGDFWQDEMNIPVETFAIGNPHVEESLKLYPQGEKKQNILIISQWTLTEEFVAIAVELNNRLGGNYTIVFRTHPAEQLNTIQEKSLIENNIMICRGCENLYESISKSHDVVGCYSTALLEAIFARKKVHILENKHSRNSLFRNVNAFFTDINGLVDRIILKDNKTVELVDEYIKPNWKLNFKHFLKHRDSEESE